MSSWVALATFDIIPSLHQRKKNTPCLCALILTANRGRQFCTAGCNTVDDTSDLIKHYILLFTKNKGTLSLWRTWRGGSIFQWGRRNKVFAMNVTIYILTCVLWCPMSTHRVKSVERSCVSILHQLHRPLWRPLCSRHPCFSYEDTSVSIKSYPNRPAHSQRNELMSWWLN